MLAAHFDAIDSVFRLVDRAIWIVTASFGHQRSGLVATWVNQSSIDPSRPLTLIGLAPNHFTAELAVASGAFGLHLLAPSQLATAWPFCLGSGRTTDKFAGLRLRNAPASPPLLANCQAWLSCRILEKYDAGDRLYLWAEVLAGERLLDGPPVTESALLAAANSDQRALLKANLAADQKLHGPLRDQWRQRLEARPD